MDEIKMRHGRITTPETRSLVATKLGLIGDWQNNEMEGGKNFPALMSGPFPVPYETDSASNAPPADGTILSGGKDDARACVNFTDQEMRDKLKALGKPDAAFTWPQINVHAGQIFNVQWAYTAKHITRGYRWFITKDQWDPQQRITRAQLETTPFSEDFYTEVPYYQHKEKMVPKSEHNVVLPQGKKGHHVILLAWIVADTGAAFYQAFDVHFSA
ncbi:lytic polysaccharide monooxygenase auxiliary activity family 9 protein [Glaciimonas sp. GG7]